MRGARRHRNAPFGTRRPRPISRFTKWLQVSRFTKWLQELSVRARSHSASPAFGWRGGGNGRDGRVYHRFGGAGPHSLSHTHYLSLSLTHTHSLSLSLSLHDSGGVVAMGGTDVRISASEGQVISH